ncbi:MAG: hypothetical protein AAF513_06600 [Pseudomonadota bacterium]
MPEATTRASLKYLVKGVASSREQQGDLQQELYAALPGAESVVIFSVVDGFRVELDIGDITPFSRTSFEPYVAEHVLPDAVSVRCAPIGSDQVQLLKAQFS